MNQQNDLKTNKQIERVAELKVLRKKMNDSKKIRANLVTISND